MTRQLESNSGMARQLESDGGMARQLESNRGMARQLESKQEGCASWSRHSVVALAGIGDGILTGGTLYPT